MQANHEHVSHFTIYLLICSGKQHLVLQSPSLQYPLTDEVMFETDELLKIYVREC